MDHVCMANDASNVGVKSMWSNGIFTKDLGENDDPWGFDQQFTLNHSKSIGKAIGKWENP